MLKIGTHHSATGEKPTWWSALFTPFTKCQCKTIKEQYEAGCRLFDIRIKKVFGIWRCANGLWFTKRTAEDIISELNSFIDPVSVMITFEGKNKNASEIINYCKYLKEKYSYIKYSPIWVKHGINAKGLHVAYDILDQGDELWNDGCQIVPNYFRFNYMTWHSYIHIPLLWKLRFFNRIKFNDNIYKIVDFL